MNREMKEKLAKKKRRRRGKGMIAVIMAGGKGTRIASVSVQRFQTYDPPFAESLFWNGSWNA